MADTERRAGYQGGFDWQTLQDRREEELTLQNVPGFQRPMAAGPLDRITGVDELTGSPVRQTVIGTEYTVRRNPDQRTARQKAEDWYNNGAQLPTLGQVSQAVASIPGAVYDSARASLAGTASLGEVIGFAPAMGAVGAMQTLPEGAIPIFGGRRARSFGREISGEQRELPTSVGFDNLERFEIDDSSIQIGDPKLLTVIGGALQQIPSDHSVLSDILRHDELFAQYPELADFPVVIDSSLSEDTYGYFNEKRGILALNPKTAANPQAAKETLMHEVQHIVQSIEDFERGTNPLSSEVWAVYQKEKAQAELDYQKEMVEYRQNAENFVNNTDWGKEIQRFERIALDNLEKLGIDTTDFDGSKESIEAMRKAAFKLSSGSNAAYRLTWLLNTAREVREQEISPSVPYSLRRRTSSFTNMINDLSDAALALKETGNFPEVEESLSTSFSNIFPQQIVSPEDWSKLRKESPRIFSPLDGVFNRAEEILVTEELPFVAPIQPTSVANRVSQHDVYRRRSGEVESRNVENRLDLNLITRRQTPPESTEDVIRVRQWGTSNQQ